MVPFLLRFTCLVEFPESSLASFIRCVPAGVAFIGYLPIGVEFIGSARFAVDLFDFIIFS